MKKSVLADVDAKSSTLKYAVEIQKAAAKVGFDWPHISDVVDKIHEELDEVMAETPLTNNHDRLHDEIGDLLFACINLARHLNVDPELAMNQANQKFYRRFLRLEAELHSQDTLFSDCSLEQLDAIWEKFKHEI